MTEIANEFVDFSKKRGVVVQGSRREVELDARVRGITLPYGGSFFILHNGEPREIKWTLWRGAGNDDHMKYHERSDIFKEADIVLCTPDKWSYPGNNNIQGCDSFVEKFERFMKEDLLVIIDEAHDFTEFLGGNQREVLRRMDELLKCAGFHMRIILASATLGDNEKAYQFAEQLLGQGRSRPILIQPTAPQEFQARVFDDLEQPEEASTLINDLFINAHPENLHRFLFFYEKRLSPTNVIEILKTLSHPDQQDFCPRNIRRAIIFIDNISMATFYKGELDRLQYKQEWPYRDHHLTVTPYHGDCAPRHRRLGEKMMKKWVLENELHVIISTSALEAGVNVSGADVIIIPDTSQCNKASLIQRIGRGGRESGHPGFIFIGVSPDENGKRILEQPEPFFTEQDGEIIISNTRAMVLNGCLQFLRDAQRLGLPWTINDNSNNDTMIMEEVVSSSSENNQRARTINGSTNLTRREPQLNEPQRRRRGNQGRRCVRDGASTLLFKPLGEANEVLFTLLGKTSIEDAIRFLLERFQQETLSTDALLLRGSGVGAKNFKIIYTNEYGNPIRIGNDENEISRPVDIAKLSLIKVLQYLHPGANYLTPQRDIVRPVQRIIQRQNMRDLRDESQIKCRPITRMDTKWQYPTKGEVQIDVEPMYHTCGTLYERDRETLDLDYLPENVQIRFGSFEIKLTWQRFRYLNPSGLKPLIGEDPIEKEELLLSCPLKENDLFFQPIISKVCGWIWSTSIPSNSETESHLQGESKSDPQENHIADRLLNIVAFELRLRAAIQLKCSPQSLIFLLKSERSRQDDNNISELSVQCYETMHVGITLEVFRHANMDSILENGELKITSEQYRHLLLDYKAREEIQTYMEDNNNDLQEVEDLISRLRVDYFGNREGNL